MEEPFGAEAERDKGEDEQQHADDAALLELQREDDPGALELGGQGRQRRRQRLQMLAYSGNWIGSKHPMASSPGRRRGRRGLGGVLLLKPVAHRRVGQQVEQLAHLRRRIFLGRRRVLRQGRRRRGA